MTTLKFVELRLWALSLSRAALKKSLFNEQWRKVVTTVENFEISAKIYNLAANTAAHENTFSKRCRIYRPLGLCRWRRCLPSFALCSDVSWRCDYLPVCSTTKMRMPSFGRCTAPRSSVNRSLVALRAQCLRLSPRPSPSFRAAESPSAVACRGTASACATPHPLPLIRQMVRPQ